MTMVFVEVPVAKPVALLIKCTWNIIQVVNFWKRQSFLGFKLILFFSFELYNHGNNQDRTFLDTKYILYQTLDLLYTHLDVCP